MKYIIIPILRLLFATFAILTVVPMYFIGSIIAYLWTFDKKYFNDMIHTIVSKEPFEDGVEDDTERRYVNNTIIDYILDRRTYIEE